MKVSWPYGSSTILNAIATNGFFGSGIRSNASSGLSHFLAMIFRSSGLGRYRTTASSSFCTPLFLYAEPQKTGVMLWFCMAAFTTA